MKQYAITAAVCALVAYLTVRKRAQAKLTCGKGATFVPTTSTQGWSSAVAAQITKYGGYCGRAGTVESVAPVNDTPIEDTSGGAQDPTLITHPWQLM